MEGIYTIVCWECDGDKHFEEYYFESHEDAKNIWRKKGLNIKRVTVILRVETIYGLCLLLLEGYLNTRRTSECSKSCQNVTHC